ncbi:ornithine carbamoyltransferase [Thalassotalea mangrovi]|uniref:Ornithine carbamoyltransferase n=1 Tax=Thalassotalea mangrovi TaxID=2572245 RepID=A0A4U1B7V8_9GAMM|nr:ornithine carbamoyltransferase [Thalassotalea mangrovi]TKB46710.1 ornithine carbamoyltransferase [Thalassotalea mangrovi]
MKHFIADTQASKTELEKLIKLAIDIKQNPHNYSQALQGKSIVTLFEKPSLRTHVSLDIGIQKLGGHSLYIGQQNGQLGKRERVKDVAKNLACWADAIVARVFDHQVLEEMAMHAGIPVVNALCDKYHPCQALADFQSLTETFGSVENLNLAYVGDGNNVSNSLMLMGSILGANVTVITPEGYGPDKAFIEQADKLATASGAKFKVSHDITDIGGQQAIYTDTWISMGDDTKVADILKTFMPYQVNEALMAATGASAVLHCQPAHLDQEITTSLFDSDKSLAFVQAENRMWAQNAVLVTLLKD